MPRKMSTIARRNLTRDKRVLGRRWGATYKGYFGRATPMNYFSKTVMPLLSHKKKVNILYAASGPGMLGERLMHDASRAGKEPNLTLLDMSAEHLKQNKNPKTRKIVGDILTVPHLGRFDMVMMRSSLDYFSTVSLQVKALQRIRQWISPGGMVVNQAASLSTKAERNLADAIYRSNSKIGNRHFQWDGDIRERYHAAGFSHVELVGVAPPLIITEREHMERYGMTSKEVEHIRAMIARIPEKQRPNIKLTKKGYKMEFLFPIYVAKK